MLLPSVLVPEAPIALLNPRHVDAGAVSAEVVRAFDYARSFHR